MAVFFGVVFLSYTSYAQSGRYTQDDYIADCQQSRSLSSPSVAECQCVLKMHANEQKQADLNYVVQNIEKFQKRITELEVFFTANNVADAHEMKSLCDVAEDSNARKSLLERRFEDDPTYRSTEQGRKDLQEIFDIDQESREHYINDFGRKLATRQENRVAGAGQKAMQYCQYRVELYKFQRQYDDIVNGIPKFNEAGRVLKQEFRQCVLR